MRALKEERKIKKKTLTWVSRPERESQKALDTGECPFLTALHCDAIGARLSDERARAPQKRVRCDERVRLPLNCVRCDVKEVLYPSDWRVRYLLLRFALAVVCWCCCCDGRVLCGSGETVLFGSGLKVHESDGRVRWNDGMVVVHKSDGKEEGHKSDVMQRPHLSGVCFCVRGLQSGERVVRRRSDERVVGRRSDERVAQL